MATWQFSINLIPRKWAIENKFKSSELYSEDGYDTDEAWRENQPKSEFINLLSDFLPPSKSWSKDQKCWGNEEEHDIQVWYENNMIGCIHIRLDLNQNLNSIIAKLTKLAKNLDCVFFFPELETITEANEFELKSALKNSKAAQFVKNPQRYLDNLPK